jgi:hypothetical protein
MYLKSRLTWILGLLLNCFRDHLLWFVRVVDCCRDHLVLYITIQVTVHKKVCGRLATCIVTLCGSITAISYS